MCECLSCREMLQILMKDMFVYTTTSKFFEDENMRQKLNISPTFFHFGHVTIKQFMTHKY